MRKAVISHSDKKFMMKAIRIARNSTVSYRHGAIIVSGGRIISTGYNKYGSSKIGREIYPKNRDPTIHAELKAILNTTNLDILKGSTLYSARAGRGKNNNYCISTPCPSCVFVMKRFGIKKIVYYDGANFIKENLQ